jgi:hypothetical protein
MEFCLSTAIIIIIIIINHYYMQEENKFVGTKEVHDHGMCIFIEIIGTQNYVPHFCPQTF